MLITYGGIRVGQAYGSNPEIGIWIAQNIRPHEIFPVSRLSWPGSLAFAPILEQTQPPWPPVIIDSLWWPWGASRFARAHVVVNESNLNLIRQQAYSGKSYKALPFIIDDGFYQTPVQTNLWMLPARPLSQAAPLLKSGESLYLLTLVDDRYFWWETSCQYAVAEGTTQWVDIYSAIVRRLLPLLLVLLTAAPGAAANTARRSQPDRLLSMNPIPPHASMGPRSIDRGIP